MNMYPLCWTAADNCPVLLDASARQFPRGVDVDDHVSPPMRLSVLVITS